MPFVDRRGFGKIAAVLCWLAPRSLPRSDQYRRHPLLALPPRKSV